MQNIKFVVKVNRGGTRAPEWVQRVDPTPIHMTTNRKLALVMGKFTAEDAIKLLQTSIASRSWSRCRFAPSSQRLERDRGFIATSAQLGSTIKERASGSDLLARASEQDGQHPID
jgi:hypothetical protein